MNKTVTEDDHVLFNTLRKDNEGKIFKRKEFQTLLAKELHFPKGEAFFMAMISGTNPPIVQISPGKYKFNDNPVYKERLQTAFNHYCKLVNGYIEAAKRKKTALNKQKVESKSFTEEDAIKLLKGLGYKIMKPTIQYEEI